MSNSCPYCGVHIKGQVKRGRKCIECNKTYCVRSKTQLYKTPILTKYQADCSDFYDGLVLLGATMNDYVSIGKNFEKKWHRKPVYGEVLWALSNSGLVERGNPLRSLDDALMALHDAKGLSMAQAKFQHATGEDHRVLLRVINNYDVAYSKLLRQNDDLSFYIYALDCCDACMEYNGNIYAAADIEFNEYLPIDLCTRKLEPNDKYSWCVCSYLLYLPPK